jgi:2-haloacid dehalogenase
VNPDPTRPEHATRSTVVVWDLGNVLIPWDRRGALGRAIDDPEELDRLADEVFTMEVNGHLDAGLPLQEIREMVEREHPGHGWVLDAYVEHFTHSLGEPIAESVQVLEELSSAGVRSVGLSNWGSVTFQGIPERYPVLGLLEGIVISGELGICKPDPRVFRHCEERFGFRADQAVFIDDSTANVTAAAAQGWDTVLFEAHLLRGEMSRRGLLPTR